MEGKEYPTRSKSGVRKVRTPWDNSSSLLFDELVAGKRSPKPPTPGGKGGGTPKQSPKNGGKKTSSKSPANFKSPGTPKEKVKSSSSKAKSGGGSVKKAPPRSSPLASAPRSQDPSPLSKVLYDYSHSPTAQITAVTLSPSKTGSAGLSREGGGASPRKFGGLYKAQKPGAKLSKSAHQKLRESLKIFDFSSDSESEDEGVTPVKKPAKPKARPPIDLETGEGMEVKDHDKTPPPKPKTNSNYRQAPAKKAADKKPAKKATPTGSQATKKAGTAAKTKSKAATKGQPDGQQDSLGGHTETGDSEEVAGGGGGGAVKRMRAEGEEEEEVVAVAKRIRVGAEEKMEDGGQKSEREESPADLSHYHNYGRLTRSAYRHIEKLGPGDTQDAMATESAAEGSAPDATAVISPPTTHSTSPLTTPPPHTSPQLQEEQEDKEIDDSRPHLPSLPAQEGKGEAGDRGLVTPQPATTDDDVIAVTNDVIATNDDVIAEAGSDGRAMLDVVEDPLSSVVHTWTEEGGTPGEQVSDTCLTGSEKQEEVEEAMETEEPVQTQPHSKENAELMAGEPDSQTPQEGEGETEGRGSLGFDVMETQPSTQDSTASKSSQDTDIRSFTPPPSALSELNSHSVEQTGDSQSQSENTESSAPGVTSSVATEGEGEKMAEEKDGEGKAEGKEEKGKGEGLTPLKITSNLEGEKSPSLEETADLSMSEAPDESAFPGDFERHLSVPTVRKTLSSAMATLSPTKTYSAANMIPSLSRSSTWPKTTSSVGAKPTQPEKESQLCTVVRDVRQAHECLESGESQQFFDEMEYLMDSLQQTQPLAVRCLGTCNLATQCLRSEFSQQIRAHEFIPKIISALGDALQHPTLSLTSSVLFYIMTRDKLNSDWDKAGIELLCGLLKESSAGLERRLGGGKAAREWDRMASKARSVLERLGEGGGGGNGGTEGGEGKGEEGEGKEEGEGETPLPKVERKPSLELFVEVEKLEVSDLARECLISLTSPVNSPHWIREELRIIGGLDTLANKAIDCYTALEGEDEEEGEGWREEREEVRGDLTTLERLLKCLENVTLMNKDNQSYLVIFDGSLLVSKLLKMISLCQKIIISSTESGAAVPVLLAVLRVLLNLTHDNELGSHRLGEQEGAVKTVLDIVFLLCDMLPDEHRFDTLVLGLGLLINMIEHNAANRQQLERIPVEYHVVAPTSPPGAEKSATQPEDGGPSGATEVKVDESLQEDGRGLLKGRNTSIKSLIALFLKHYRNAEGATIEVPTPQRLSQISSSPHSSPLRPSQAKRDLTPSFADRLKVQSTQREKRSKKRKSRKRKKAEDGTDCLPSSQESESSTKTDSQQTDSQGTEVAEDEEQSESSESEPGSPGIDPLVFSREDFDTALSQAGQQMEDSVVAAYCALVLGLLAKHNLDTVDVVRNGMPSKTFSEMMSVLRKFVSFMNLTGSSGTGLENVRRIIKYLEAV